MTARIRVLQYGLGPIGIEAVKLIASRPNLDLVGAIDIDPAKVGKDVGEICGIGRMGIKAVSCLEELPRKAHPQVSVHSTVSWLADAMSQLLDLASRGIHVVSSTEELLYPHWKYPKQARQLESAAHKNNIVIFGTGVNPGFVLDTVAILLSGACTQVNRIFLERQVDAGTRRFPLQLKVGAGITKAEFKKRVKTGRMGHAGFVETLALVARAMGWNLETINETIQPVISERLVRTPYLTVEPGQVAGIHQTCKGKASGKVVIDADLKMYVGALEPHDRIIIEGIPGIDCCFEGGVAGDEATIAMLVNAIPLVCQATPGLKSVLDLPIPRWTGG